MQDAFFVWWESRRIELFCIYAKKFVAAARKARQPFETAESAALRFCWAPPAAVHKTTERTAFIVPRNTIFFSDYIKAPPEPPPVAKPVSLCGKAF
jgi:hypothetical protein